MYDRSSIERINQATRTRRIAFALILLALALPSLFAWSDNVALESAARFTGQLAAVTLCAYCTVVGSASLLRGRAGPGVAGVCTCAGRLVGLRVAGWTRCARGGSGTFDQFDAIAYSWPSGACRLKIGGCAAIALEAVGLCNEQTVSASVATGWMSAIAAILNLLI